MFYDYSPSMVENLDFFWKQIRGLPRFVTRVYVILPRKLCLLFVPKTAEFVYSDSEGLELVSGFRIDLTKRLKVVITKPLGVL